MKCTAKSPEVTAYYNLLTSRLLVFMRFQCINITISAVLTQTDDKL